MGATITQRRVKARAQVQVFSFWLWIGRRVLATTTGTEAPGWFVQAKKVLDSMHLDEGQVARLNLVHKKGSKTFELTMLTEQRIY